MPKNRKKKFAVKVQRKETEFFPLHRCKFCPKKWKRVDRDPEALEKIVTIRSCKDDCPFITLIERKDVKEEES